MTHLFTDEKHRSSKHVGKIHASQKNGTVHIYKKHNLLSIGVDKAEIPDDLNSSNLSAVFP